MSANGSRPTAEDVRASFDAAGDPYEARPVPEDVVISERAVIGSAMRSSALAAEAVAAVQPRHMSRNVHRVVFEAVAALADAGAVVDPVSVAAELARAGWLAKIGDTDMGSHGAYLHSLLERSGDIGYHAPRILAAARHRAIRDALRSALALADSDGWDPDAYPDRIRLMVDEATALATPSVLRPNSEAVTEVLDAIEAGEQPGLSTGWRDLDDATGGMRDGEMTVIGGRPGDGKTLLGLCIADHAGSRLDLPVLFASLEMTEKQLTMRRIAAVAKVPLVNLVRHQAAPADWDRIARVSGRLMTTRLHVDDMPRQSFGHIRGQFRAMERAGNRPRLLVIDYLGFMASAVVESRQQAVADLARQGHETARDLGIPVLMLAQLNRLVDSRADRIPVLSDLRESGEIEQSADVVILLHRPDAREPEHPRAGEIDLVIRKNRQGPLCTVTLCFQGQYGRIVSLSGETSEWDPSSAVGGWNE